MAGSLTRQRLCAVIVITAVILVVLQAACGPKAPSEGAVLVANGKNVFASHCAKCHGPHGEGAFGPVIIGRGVLDKYKNAGALLEFVSLDMPYDSPGTLPAEEYLQVVSFLLAENSYVAPNDIKAGTISGIQLTSPQSGGR